jgi:hypothetical protein
MIFATTAFKHVIAADAVQEYIFIESLVWLLQYPKLSGCFYWAYPKLLPIVKCRFYYPVFATDDEVDFYSFVVAENYQQRVHDQCSHWE